MITSRSHRPPCLWTPIPAGRDACRYRLRRGRSTGVHRLRSADRYRCGERSDTVGAVQLTLQKPPIMLSLRSTFFRFDVRLTRWTARHAIALLRVSLGLVYLWFGLLKFFPGMSPAQELAGRTIALLSFGLIAPGIAVPLLAVLETAIGLALVSGRWLRVTLLLLLGQMLGTITPLLFFPHETFTSFPFAPTLEGQYIIKNLVLVSAAIVLGGTVRGGKLVADPVGGQEAGRTGQP